MANWLSKIFSTGAIGFADGIAGIVDRFVQTKEEKTEAMLQLEALIQKRDSELEQTIRAELGAKERVMVAELSSGDNYTRRARPTMAYFGMAVIGLNYVVLPWGGFFTGVSMPDPIQLPEAFWLSWGGVVGVWSIGRSMERRGAKNNLVSMITGGKQPGLVE
jgi:hypothetical protein